MVLTDLWRASILLVSPHQSQAELLCRKEREINRCKAEESEEDTGKRDNHDKRESKKEKPK
jgi:hypothetical protein